MFDLVKKTWNPTTIHLRVKESGEIISVVKGKYNKLYLSSYSLPQNKNDIIIEAKKYL